MQSRSLLFLALLAVGCNHQLVDRRAEDVAGLCVLPSSPTQLNIEGQLNGRVARLSFDTGMPLNAVTAGCFDNPAPGERTKFPLPFGGDKVFPVTVVGRLTVGDRQVSPFRAALVPGGACQIIFGVPWLESVALRFSAASRQLCFVGPGHGTAAPQFEPIALVRPPQADWLLATIRGGQGDETFLVPAVLRLGEANTQMSLNSLRQAHLTLVQDLLPEVAERGAHVDWLELSPTSRTGGGLVHVLQLTSTALVPAIIGADVLSQFDFVLDAKQNVLWLRRPASLTTLAPMDAGVGTEPIWQKAKRQYDALKAQLKQQGAESSREPADP
jgi:hypothetical protein